MENILIHGLGQDEKAWNKVVEELNDIEVSCPNLFSLVKEEKMDYKDLYKAFANHCNSKKKSKFMWAFFGRDTCIRLRKTISRKSEFSYINRNAIQYT